MMADKPAGFRPLVSIVIPVYNGHKYLGEAVDSALGQDYGNVEVIVVDDGSCDQGRTEAVARSYRGRIRYFRKENGGVSTALNLGIGEMRGEYFSWLSHDDVYLPEKVSAQIALLGGYDEAQRERVIPYSDFYCMDAGGRTRDVSRIPTVPPESLRYALICKRFVLHGCTPLIHRRCFRRAGLFDESLRLTQDYDMWFRLAEDHGFVHVPRPLLRYRVHAASDSNSDVPKFKREVNAFYKGAFDRYFRGRMGDRWSYSEMALGLRRNNCREAADYILAAMPARRLAREWPGVLRYRMWPLEVRADRVRRKLGAYWELLQRRRGTATGEEGS